MMIFHKIVSKYILVIIILLTVIVENCISQNKSIIVNKDYLITTQKFNFIISDTVVESNICVRPNGILEFVDSFQYASRMVFGITLQKGDSVINLREKYIERSTDTIFLKSYFPPLLIHDSSLLNYSEYPFESSRFSYEMKYSTILSNFNKPRINDSKTDTVIRIILPINDTSFLSFVPVTYSIITLTINNGNGNLNYSEGHYDASKIFIVTSNKSYAIADDEIKKTIKIIQKVDFKKEFYTAVIGLIAIEEYFIEIKLNDIHFAFERALYYGIEKGIKMKDYPDQKHISKLYDNILNLKPE